MGYPIKNNGQLKFNDAANIIQTGAATFKDHWRVDNSFYMVDSMVRVDVPAQIHQISLVPSDNLTELVYKCKNRNGGIHANAIEGQQYFMAEQSGTGDGKK